MSRVKVGWLLALLGATLVGIGFLDEDHFWWWFFSGISPYILFAWGASEKCPECERWWAADSEGFELLEHWQESKDIPREDITRNGKGEVIARKTRIEAVIVNVEKRRYHYKCRFCNASWTKTKEHRDR